MFVYPLHLYQKHETIDNDSENENNFRGLFLR